MRLRIGGMRARIALAAGATFAVAISVGAIALLGQVEANLIQNLDDVAETRASDLAGLEPSELPRFAPAGEDGSFVQVIDAASGEILGGSADIPPGQRLATFEPTDLEPLARSITASSAAGGRDVRVLALRSRHAEPIIIYVAVPLESVFETMALLRGALLIGSPLLILLVVGIAWIFVGRALRPVEAIRVAVAATHDHALTQRVEVPASNDEISRLARTMNEMLQRLESASIRQRRFIADASHELQTPLASMRTDLEVAVQHPQRSEWRTVARDVLEANLRMERLVRDLLYLARADDATHRAATRPTTMQHLEEIVADEISRSPQGSIPVTIVSLASLVIRGNRTDLGRLVRNLLDNAARHARTTIQVELTVRSDLAVLIVSDDGPGVPIEHRERIFERFTRVDASRARGDGGTGLGLAIVADIVATHGGTVAEEGSGQGARFVVRLPVA